MNEELTKLIERAIDGDLAAFEQVMRQKAKQIVYVSVKLMKNPADGEDAAQEAMLKMYQHLNELKEPEAFQSWMYQIVTRTCIDIRRKQQVHDDHDYLEMRSEVTEMRKDFLPQEYIEDVDKRDFLMKLINNLPENYRVCLLMFYYEDMTYQQIAQAMGISEKSVDNMLQRGRRNIKKQLTRRYGDQLKLLSLQGAALPVLTQLFEWDATAAASTDMVARVLSKVSTTMAEATLGTAGAAATSSAATASGATTTTGTGGSVTTAAATSGSAATASTTAGALSLSTKAVIGITAALTAAGGAAVVLQPGSEGVSALSDSPAGQEQQAILTLADMIGQTAADQLQAYTDGAADWSEWTAFLTELATTNISGAVLGEARYTLYHLEKQDKQLLIVEKQSNSQIEIAYHFTDRHEEAPKRDALFDSLEGWRQ